MALAQIFEEWTEEHRQNGSRKPIAEAELDFYEMTYAGVKQRPDFEKFRRTLKKKRLQGQRELNEYRQKLEEFQKK
jgi:hypothetical protein